MTDEIDQINLNIDDIANAVKIIDYAADQGTFKSWDNIRQILAVRDKLNAFVAAAKFSEKTAENNLNLQN